MTEELIISEGYILGQLGFSASAIIGALNITGTWTEVQAFDKAIKAKPVITPTADAAYGQWFSDSADGNKPKFMKPDGTVIQLEGTGGAAPTTATYITVSADATLGAERVLTAGSTKITLTDGGPNSTISIDVAQANLSLSAIGGAVTEGQLPASVVLDTEENDFQANQTFQDAIHLFYYEAAQITADQNNYTPPELANASILQIHSDAARNITGIDDYPDKILILINKGSFPITLQNNSVSSLSENRFSLGRDIVLGAGKSIPLYYNFQIGKWTSIISSAAFIDTSNRFQAGQNIEVDGTSDALDLVRTDNAIGNTVDLDFQLHDNLGNIETYATIEGEIDDNTDGSEDGSLIFSVSIGNVITSVARCDGSLNGVFRCGGANERAALSDSGLTATRTFTFPDATTQLAGLAITNTFTDSQVIRDNGAGVLDLQRDTSTVGDLTELNFMAKDSVGNYTQYASIASGIIDNTDTSEDGKLEFRVRIANSAIVVGRFTETGTFECGGTSRRITLSDSGLTSQRTYSFPDATTTLACLTLGQTFNYSGTEMIFRRDDNADNFAMYRASNTINDTLNLSLRLNDSAGNGVNYARIATKIIDPVDGSEDGQLSFQTRIANVLTEQVTINEFGSVDIKKAGIQFSGDISPTQITADQNDYNPTNLATSSVIRLDSDTTLRSITGLAGGADGRMMIMYNIGANTILLKSNNTASSANNRFFTDGYDIPLFPDTPIQLIYDSSEGSGRWKVFDVHSKVRPPTRYGFYYMNHCLSLEGTSTEVDDVEWTTSSGTNVVLAGEPGAAGIIRQGTSVSSTGRATVASTSVIPIILGGNTYWRFECLSRIPTLSTGTERFTVRLGFMDVVSGDPVDGVFFRYIDNVNAGNWVLVARSNSVETVTNSSVPPTTGFDRMTIIVNPAGTSAEFFQDGVSLGTVGSNIPTAGGREMGFAIQILKSVGTTARNNDIDYFELLSYLGNAS